MGFNKIINLPYVHTRKWQNITFLKEWFATIQGIIGWGSENPDSTRALLEDFES